MEIRKLNDVFSVAPQIAASDVPAIAAAGFRSLVSNRPDSEDGAVPHGDIEAAAAKAGLAFRFIPVVSGSITADDVAEMKAALEELPAPVLAYCRSGTRCMNLYGLVQQMKG